MKASSGSGDIDILSYTRSPRESSIVAAAPDRTCTPATVKASSSVNLPSRDINWSRGKDFRGRRGGAGTGDSEILCSMAYPGLIIIVRESLRAHPSIDLWSSNVPGPPYFAVNKGEMSR